MLKFLDKDAPECSVKIYASYCEKRGSIDSRPKLEARFNREIEKIHLENIIDNIEVHLFNAKEFSRDGHDRHVRFDRELYTYPHHAVQTG